MQLALSQNQVLSQGFLGALRIRPEQKLEQREIQHIAHNHLDPFLLEAFHIGSLRDSAIFAEVPVKTRMKATMKWSDGKFLWKVSKCNPRSLALPLHCQIAVEMAEKYQLPFSQWLIAKDQPIPRVKPDPLILAQYHNFLFVVGRFE